jgi:dGTP triphosphohydrolase
MVLTDKITCPGNTWGMERSMEELLETIVHEYLGYIAPLAHLIEKITKSGQDGKQLNIQQLEDIVEEATSSTFNILPLHTLLSSLKDADIGDFGPSSSRLIHRIISQHTLPQLRDNMARSVTRLINDYLKKTESTEHINNALKAASNSICIELSHMKDLNSGFLPHPDLKVLWETFSCAEEFAELDLR